MIKDDPQPAAVWVYSHAEVPDVVQRTGSLQHMGTNIAITTGVVERRNDVSDAAKARLIRRCFCTTIVESRLLHPALQQCESRYVDRTNPLLGGEHKSRQHQAGLVQPVVQVCRP